MAKRLLRIHNVSGKEGPVVTVSIDILTRTKTVYFHIVNRPLKYPFGRSRIVYIGMTETGIPRIMGSVAEKLEREFGIHGVKSVEVHEIGCTPRQKVQSRMKLERASLLAFRELYGSIPYFNKQGERLEETDEFKVFNRAQIRKFILMWSSRSE